MLDPRPADPRPADPRPADPRPADATAVALHPSVRAALVRRFPREWRPRLERRLGGLALVGGFGVGEARARVQLAVLLGSEADLERFEALCALAETDPRDALVAGGLADEGWRARLAAIGLAL